MSATGIATCGVLLFGLGLAAGNRGIAVAGAYVAMAAWLAVLYSKNSLGHIRYRRHLSSNKATVGDTITLRLDIENRKPLPVLWLTCEDEVPGGEALSMPGTHPHYRPDRAILRSVTYLKWFERVEREFKVRCLARGVFPLGPVKLTSGDIMGFRETSIVVEEPGKLTVYPRMAAVRGISWEEHFPMGDSPSRGWLNPDPLTIAGARPYSPGTPLRQIAWRATARTGEIQEKLLEPTRRRDIVVALSISTAERFWEGINPETLDSGVFVCASLCRELMRQGTPFGLAANTVGTRSGRSSLVIPPGSSRSHLQKVLGVLAGVSAPWMEFYATIRSLPREMAPDAGVLVIFARQLKADWEAVLKLAGSGRPVTAVVLHPDERFSSCYREVPTYSPSSPLDWRTSEVITFVRLG